MTPKRALLSILPMSTYLPEDVMVKIMERLPTKSLIRFTGVSKRWKFIILSDPHLAKSQFQIACQQKTLSHRLLVKSHSESGFEYLDLNTLSSSSTELICPFQQPDCAVRILCSCNGLVLTTCSLYMPIEEMFFWNPSTRFFKQLPDPKNYVDVNEHSYLLRDHYGFGYLSAADDYKVLVVHTNRRTHKLRALIFSLKADTWKTIEFPSHNYELRGKGVLSDEAIHWLNVAELDIVAFDLATESFRKMPMPAGDYHLIKSEVWKYRYLGTTFRGCLCAFDYSNINAGFIALWIMKEYGVADSWTKLLNIKVSNQPESPIICFSPIMVSETSILLRPMTATGGMLMMKSIDEPEKFETCLSRNLDLSQVSQLTLCAETLLSVG